MYQPKESYVEDMCYTPARKFLPIREINPDYSTFEILENKEYAKDKNTFYRRGIENADPITFKVISDNG